MSTVSGIYSIKNIITNELYIGSSKNIYRRFETHKSKLKNNKHINIHLQNSVNKYGLNNFTFNIIEECNNLIEREQYYINNYDWSNLYNLSKEAGSGGGDVKRKELYLIDLSGNIIKKFNSGTELCQFLNQKLLVYKSINTKSIKKKKYRIVTPHFYNNNLTTIKSWKSYSCETVQRSTNYNKLKYEVEKDGIITKFNNKSSVAAYIKVSHQRISQILELITKKGLKEYFIKKTGFKLRFL